MTAEEVIAVLALAPLPGEGGFFRETYRSTLTNSGAALPAAYQGGSRSAGTCILYLLTPQSFSALHRLRTDEVYHFYRGDSVELTILDASGGLQILTLGSRFEMGEQCQVTVPAGAWQGSRLRPGGAWALLGTSMAPGFDFSDLELADTSIVDEFSEHRDALISLLRVV